MEEVSHGVFASQRGEGQGIAPSHEFGSISRDLRAATPPPTTISHHFDADTAHSLSPYPLEAAEDDCSLFATVETFELQPAATAYSRDHRQNVTPPPTMRSAGRLSGEFLSHENPSFAVQINQRTLVLRSPERHQDNRVANMQQAPSSTRWLSTRSPVARPTWQDLASTEGGLHLDENWTGENQLAGTGTAMVGAGRKSTTYSRRKFSTDSSYESERRAQKRHRMWKSDRCPEDGTRRLSSGRQVARQFFKESVVSKETEKTPRTLQISPSQSSLVDTTYYSIDGKKQPPLKPLSAYNFFFRDERDRIVNGGKLDLTDERLSTLLQNHWSRDRQKKRSHRRGHGKVSFRQLNTLVSQRWNTLSSEELAFFRMVADDDLKRYEAEMRREGL